MGIARSFWGFLKTILVHVVAAIALAILATPGYCFGLGPALHPDQNCRGFPVSLIGFSRS